MQLYNIIERQVDKRTDRWTYITHLPGKLFHFSQLHLQHSHIEYLGCKYPKVVR